MGKLVWLTDTHLVAPDAAWPAGVDPLAALRRCLDGVRRLHGDADRIVVSGDLVQLRHEAAYGLLRAELESLRIPLRVLAGNHDDRAALAAAFPGAATGGFIQSAEVIGDTAVIYLDTVAGDGGHHGELCAARLEWIGEQVEAAGDGQLLVFLHHPPVDIGVPALDRLKLRHAGALAEALARRRVPTHLFFGHVHRNVCGSWAGHPFAALKSTHVQYTLDMSGTRLVRSPEPAGYGVIAFRPREVVVNFQEVVA